MLKHKSKEYYIRFDPKVKEYIETIDIQQDKCPYCTKQFNKKQSMLIHIKEIHQKPVQYCKECKKGFQSSRDLKLHIEEHHLSIYRSHKVKQINQAHMYNKLDFYNTASQSTNDDMKSTNNFSHEFETTTCQSSPLLQSKLMVKKEELQQEECVNVVGKQTDRQQMEYNEQLQRILQNVQNKQQQTEQQQQQRWENLKLKFQQDDLKVQSQINGRNQIFRKKIQKAKVKLEKHKQVLKTIYKNEIKPLKLRLKIQKIQNSINKVKTNNSINLNINNNNL